MTFKEFIQFQLKLSKETGTGVFEPQTPSYDYECENIDTASYCDFNYEEFLENNYNIYNKLHKKILGVDASGEYNIYEYTYTAPQHKYTILLSAGMHGIELGGILGLSCFIYNILNSDDEGFKTIRNCCTIKFIPIINPWGVSQTPLNYGNSNQVNINKNFKYQGIEATMEKSFKSDNGWAYGGDLDNPEVETKILKQWYSENRYSNLYIDCHTALYRTLNNKYGEGTLFYGYASPDVIDIVNKCNNKILNYYKMEGYDIKNIGSYLPIDNSTIKNIMLYREYGLSNISIEQIVSYDGLDWSGLNGDNNAVKNYVLMMRQYVLGITSQQTH